MPVIHTKQRPPVVLTEPVEGQALSLRGNVGTYRFKRFPARLADAGRPTWINRATWWSSAVTQIARQDDGAACRQANTYQMCQIAAPP